MKKMISLALVMSAAFISCGASAGGYGHNNNGHHGGYDSGKDHATKRELKAEANTRYNADKALQHNINKEADTRYQADKHLQKQTTSVNGDLQGAKAYQGGVNQQVQHQIGQVDQKATGAQQAAQIANEKADAGAVRADGIEQRATVTDNRSINNAVRLDGAEAGIRETNGAVAAVNGDLQGAKQYQGGVNQQVQGQIKVNSDNIASVNGDLQGAKEYQGGVNHQVQGQITNINTVNANQQTTLNQHTSQITTINDVNAAQQTQINTGAAINNRQDGQIGQLQSYASDMDQRLGGRLDSQQSQINKNSRDIKEAKNAAAAALAVAAHQFSTDRSAGFQTAISAATIGGSQAIAVGAGGAVSENVFINAAFTKSGSVTGGAVSGTYRWK